MSKVKPIPDGFQTITPYLMLKDAEKEIDFVKRAFGAEVKFIARDDDGSVKHAEVKIGTSMVMMGQEGGPWKSQPSSIYMYVEDVDAKYKSAIDAGAKSLNEPTDMYYGDRSAGVEDANGITWWIGTHVEDVSEEEMKRRSAEQKKAG